MNTKELAVWAIIAGAQYGQQDAVRDAKDEKEFLGHG